MGTASIEGTFVLSKATPGRSETKPLLVFLSLFVAMLSILLA